MYVNGIAHSQQRKDSSVFSRLEVKRTFKQCSCFSVEKIVRFKAVLLNVWGITAHSGHSKLQKIESYLKAEIFRGESISGPALVINV